MSQLEYRIHSSGDNDCAFGVAIVSVSLSFCCVADSDVIQALSDIESMRVASATCIGMC